MNNTYKIKFLTTVNKYINKSGIENGTFPVVCIFFSLSFVSFGQW